jgi:hypothetical protein
MTTKRRLHGCCADGACSAETCMELPAGKACGDCVHVRRCTLIFGMRAEDTSCHIYPRRFRESEVTR